MNLYSLPSSSARSALSAVLLLGTMLSGCGGGGGAGITTSASGTTSTTIGNAAVIAGTGSGSGSSATLGTPTTPSTSPTATGPGSAVALATVLGRSPRVLLGLGTYNPISAMQAQGIVPDIIDTYLPGVGSTSWISYNSPSGAYVTQTAQQVAAAGAVPMFTLYGMAQNGDGNITGISNSTFMSAYWAQARLMFQLLGSFGNPVLVNLEPDFWGYVYNTAPAHDPTQLAAVVSSQSECSTLPNTAAGIAPCLLAMARAYAPKALVGVPPSFWGETAAQLAPFMRALGAAGADFIVAQTSDRDAGCAEVAAPPAECAGRTGPFYWDENNLATPNFLQSETQYADYATALGGSQALLWWQTPLGVPSATPGGSNQHYRDNHVDYMLRHTAEYAAIHTLGMVFSGGAASQTNITSDGGQFATLSKAYLSAGGSPLQ